MKATPNILMLEENEDDAELVQRLLKKELFNLSLALTKEDFLLALDRFEPSVILADNSLVGFDAFEEVRKSNDRFPGKKII